MVKTGHKQKQSKVSLLDIANEFRDAMLLACRPFIVEQGLFTPRMEEIWGRYRAWCIKNA
jgi:hypothetical protein